MIRLRTLAADGRGRLLATGSLAFVTIGALQALYGPAFGALQERYGLDAGTVSLVVSAHFFGSFVTIGLSGVLIARFGYRRPLAVAGAMLAAGAFAVAVSPSWPLTLAAALLIGLGFGIVDIGTNLLLARSYGADGAPALNLVNALFGVGAVLGPLLVGLFLPSVTWPFALLGVASLVVAGLSLRIEEPEAEPPGERLALSLGSVLGFVVLFWLYVASEVGVASWEPKQLEPLYGARQAAFYTSVFWGAITVGRFVAIPLSAFVRARTLVLGSSALALVGALLASNGALAPYAYALVGLAFAPIFPTGIVWLQEVFPRRAEQITPIVIATASLGPVLSAPLIGLAYEAGGPAAIPLSVATLAGLMLLVTAAMVWRTRGQG